MLAFSGHWLEISFSSTLHRDTFGCLTFIQTIRLKILCINIKRESLLINIKRLYLTLWKNDLPQTVAKSAEETEQTRKNVSFQITVHIFCSFSNGMASTIWFPKWNSCFPMEMLSALCLTGKPRRRERKARRGQCETEKGGKLRFSLFL